jgi:hypothetical protein
MRASLLICAGIWLCCGYQAHAQINPLSVGAPQPVKAKIASSVEVKTPVSILNGYHCNSNTPSEDYLIPLKLTWTAGALDSPAIEYPQPKMEKFSFSDKPLSVYTGDFVITTRFKVGASANPGTVFLSGKLRYQACNDRMCLPPKTLDVSVPVEIFK